MKILFKYPTRGRPDWFKENLRRWLELWSGQGEVLFLVTIDRDDVVMWNDEMIAYLEDIGKVWPVSYLAGDHASKIEAYNAGLAERPWDMVMTVADDLEPQEGGYDLILIEDMKTFWPRLDGVLYYNDGRTGHRVITHPCMGRALYDRLGWLCCPHYVAWSDRESTKVFKQWKCCHYRPKNLFRHNWKKYGDDATYERASLWRHHDLCTFEKRQREGFQPAKEK